MSETDNDEPHQFNPTYASETKPDERSCDMFVPTESSTLALAVQ